MTESIKQSNMSDSNRFLWMFMIGAVLMLVLKLVLSVPQIFVTVPPALIMVLYFLQLARGHHATNRPERAGDNVYYLGFLFTLVSLGLALFEFGVDAGNKGGLIADFAVALTTTILGVLFRVWLTQGDKEIDEYEKDARLHITDAVDGLQDDLKRSREVLTEFATTTRQLLEESRDIQKEQLEKDREEFQVHFKEALETMGSILTASVAKGSVKLSKELEHLANNIAAEVGVFAKNVEILNSSSGELSESLTKAVSALEELPDPVSLVEEKIHGIVEPLEKASAEMVAILDKQHVWAEKSAEGMNAVLSSLESIGETVSNVGESSGSAIARIQSPVDNLLRQLKSVDGTLAIIVRQVEGLQVSGTGLEKLPQKFSRSIDGIDALGRSIGEANEKISGSLNGLYHDLERARESQRESVIEDSGKLRQLVSDREILLAALTKTNRDLDSQVGQLRDQLGGMSEALLGAAKFIRTETGSIS